MKHSRRLNRFLAPLLLLFGLGLAALPAGAAEQPPPAANQWTVDCGIDPGTAERFCVLVYIYVDPTMPGDFVNFGLMRRPGMEATFLQTRTGFGAGSRVWLQVDGLPAREFAPPRRTQFLQSPQPSDPVAMELAKGQYVLIAFQPANGQRRTIRIPLEGFALLFEQVRAEVP